MVDPNRPVTTRRPSNTLWFLLLALLIAVGVFWYLLDAPTTTLDTPAATPGGTTPPAGTTAPAAPQ